MSYKYFTSESVSEGHPDKMADQISDAVLDAALAQDPDARVGCEVLIKGLSEKDLESKDPDNKNMTDVAKEDLVVVSGEIKMKEGCSINVEEIARKVIKDIGYTDREYGMDYESCKVLDAMGKQATEISKGVDQKDSNKTIGAGDQGMMFGYATDETPVLMPVAITYAHKLMQKQAELRKSGKVKWLRPDAKAQLSFEFDEEGKPIRISTIVVSTQHDEDVSQEEIRETVIREILTPVLPGGLWSADDESHTKIHVNPTGSFVRGGPESDCGLTGRKIIVDTYGGAAPHGGGAFSGKDPSKVDRSACYAARYVAKNIVAAGLASKCEIQVSYAIGVAEPTSVSVRTFGTGIIKDEQIEELVKKVFDLTPQGIIKMLDLARPIYQRTATYGHFGREDENFPWEQTNKVEELKAELAKAQERAG